MQLSAIAITLSVVFTVICCLIPESPRYKAYCDMKYKHTYEFETAAKLHNLWSEEDLQRKSIVDLFNELKKLNLLSLIGLILAEQFIGGISILFYMKHYARLSGELKLSKPNPIAAPSVVSNVCPFHLNLIDQDPWMKFCFLSFHCRCSDFAGTCVDGSGTDAYFEYSVFKIDQILENFVDKKAANHQYHGDSLLCVSAGSILRRRGVSRP